MNILFGLIVPVVSLAVLVAIIVGVVSLSRRAGEEADSDPGIGTLKRVYYYVLGFVALGFASSGVTLLVKGLLDVIFGERVISGGEAQLALALALTLVGTPIWLYVLSLAQRSLREHPVETGTFGRKFYVYLVLGVSAAVGASGLVLLLRGVLGAADFNAGQIALPLVMGGVWYFHWRIETLEGQPSEMARLWRRLYIYLTAAYGLGLLGAGVALFTANLLTTAYDALAGTLLLSPGSDDLWSSGVRGGVAMALVGGIWWWWHWHRVAGVDGQSEPRQVYLYLYAVLGGAATVVVSLSILLYGLLQWAVDAPGVLAASTHFRFLPDVIAGLAVGGAIWGYHSAVIHQEAGALAGGLLAARRVYRYLVAALGLGTLATGLVLLFGVVVGVLVPEAGDSLVGSDWWKQPLDLGLTLALVGVPIWGRYWWAAQREASAHSDEERTAQSRRVFIYGVFGIAVLITLGDLSALLFVILRDLLEGELALSALQQGKWFIGALLMAGAISVYYWLIVREDREAAGEQPAEAMARPRRKSVTVAVSADGVVRQIEAKLGYSVRWWRTLDDAGSQAIPEADIESLADQVNETAGDNVLMVIDATGARVLPYEVS
ncbi:MAG: DUF5671 domain-containing protein [Chloroflexi bacterium]|nr:DUF5671 domain-containing protein [Chloroflexota bacterium]